MSTSLYYELPVPDQFLGYGLKFIIAPIVWGHDGSLGGEQTLITKDTEFYVNDKSVKLYEFLKGIALGKDDVAGEAQKLVELIDQYDSVFISLKG